MNKKMKRDNSTKSQHHVLVKCLRGISSLIKKKWTFDAHMALPEVTK